MSLRIASPVTAGAEIQLSGAAAGALELRLYDLQGRLVRRQTETASGLGTDLLRLDLRRDGLTAGMYFLRVRDARGNEAPAAKLVILR
jgi:hypothetical protein